MTVEFHVILGAMGRTVVTFHCDETRRAASVDVHYFIHTRRDLQRGIWDETWKCFVVPESQARVGDYDDWRLVPAVQVAAQALGVVVPVNLWYHETDGVNELQAMAQCSEADRIALEYEPYSGEPDPILYDDYPF